MRFIQASSKGAHLKTTHLELSLTEAFCSGLLSLGFGQEDGFGVCGGLK